MLSRKAILHNYEVIRISPGDGLWVPAGIWASYRPSTTLLILGDRTETLSRRAVHWVAVNPCGQVRGMAVRFLGFTDPMISIAAEDISAAHALLSASHTEGAVLAIGAEQVALWPDLSWASDPWLVAPCVVDEEAEGMVEAVRDVRALGVFYRSVGVGFWCEEMGGFGHSFVIRRGAEIICAGSVNFVIDSIGYAQIGAIVTHPDYRGQSSASTILRAVRSSLARNGTQWCGLFADGAHDWLPGFYGRRGFTRAGAYLFAALSK